MTQRRRFEIECDQCGATASVQEVSRRKARRLFRREAGWDVNPSPLADLADLCPSCSGTGHEHQPGRPVGVTTGSSPVFRCECGRRITQRIGSLPAEWVPFK